MRQLTLPVNSEKKSKKRATKNKANHIVTFPKLTTKIKLRRNNKNYR